MLENIKGYEKQYFQECISTTYVLYVCIYIYVYIYMMFVAHGRNVSYT